MCVSLSFSTGSWAFAAPETDLDALYTGSFATYQDEWTQGSQTCVAWFNSKLGKLPDGPVKFTRMLSLVVFIGGLCLVTLMIAYAVWDPLFCVTPERSIDSVLPDRQNWPTFRVSTVTAVGCGMMAVYTALFLSVLGTEACAEDRVDRCRLAAGGHLCVLSVLLWTAAALVMWFWGHVTAPIAHEDRGVHQQDKKNTKEGPPTLQDMQQLEATEIDEENTLSEE